ncbi:MAG TPA: hypothetical protein VIY48_22110, partial [Candidatus Paceibacterota bacterium]
NATGSPLSPVQNSQLLIGCAAADTVTATDSSVYFVGQSKVSGQAYGAGFSVYKLSGMTPEKISTDSLERLLNADGLANSWGYTCNILGHTVYVINLPTTGVSLAYDLSNSKWYFYTTTTAGTAKSVSALICAAQYAGSTTGTATATSTAHGFSDGDPVTIAGATPSGYNGTFNITYVDANTFTYPTATVLANATGTITATGNTESNMQLLTPCQFGSLQLFQGQSDGKIYQMSDTTYQDNGQYINSKIRTKRWDGAEKDLGSKPKFLPYLDVVTDRTSSTAYVRYTDDDYQTYSHYRSVDLSLSRSRLTRLGRFIRRAFEVRHTDSKAFRFQGLDLPIEQGQE